MNNGYARCSTNESKQDIDRQLRELKAAGAERIYLEYEHGDSSVKPKQQTMFEQAQEGDTILTTEVSRLSRSTKQLCEIIDIIQKKKLRLVILGSITIDCRNGTLDPMTKAFVQMSGIFAELELSMIRARVKSGMENAKAKGGKNRTATGKRRQHTGGVLSALSGLLLRPAQSLRVRPCLRFEQNDGIQIYSHCGAKKKISSVMG